METRLFSFEEESERLWWYAIMLSRMSIKREEDSWKAKWLLLWRENVVMMREQEP
jgi:hypothetical protein